MIQLQEGKKYVARDGRVYGPLIQRYSKAVVYPFKCEASGYTWTATGVYCEGCEGDTDLVNEWVEPSAEAPQSLVDYLDQSPAPDSGSTEAFADMVAQAFKADAGKPQFGLLHKGCPDALLGVVKVLTFAVTPKPAGKGYVPHSWKGVPDGVRRYTDALYRHLNAIERGEVCDEESGLPHIYHVATNALFLSQFHTDFTPE